MIEDLDGLARWQLLDMDLVIRQKCLCLNNFK